jgi:hypothetical protein
MKVDCSSGAMAATVENMKDLSTLGTKEKRKKRRKKERKKERKKTRGRKDERKRKKR